MLADKKRAVRAHCERSDLGGGIGSYKTKYYLASLYQGNILALSALFSLAARGFISPLEYPVKITKNREFSDTVFALSRAYACACAPTRALPCQLIIWWGGMLPPHELPQRLPGERIQ